jgi:hypothetical protein
MSTAPVFVGQLLWTLACIYDMGQSLHCTTMNSGMRQYIVRGPELRCPRSRSRFKGKRALDSRLGESRRIGE